MASRSILRQKRITPFTLSGEVMTPSDIALTALVVSEIQGLVTNLSVGDGQSSRKAGNLRGQFITHIFPSGANTLQIIPHGLGVVPSVVLMAMADRACRIYDSGFRAGWGESQIQLYCDTASAKISLLLLA